MRQYPPRKKAAPPKPKFGWRDPNKPRYDCREWETWFAAAGGATILFVIWCFI